MQFTRQLFNDGWEFFELSLDASKMYNDEKPILYTPDQFFESSLKYEYKSVAIPHDWMIFHTKDLYKNSVGFYKKTFTLTKDQATSHLAIRFESVYMNCAVYINGKKACEWKYGYSTFEADLTDLVNEGKNLVQVIVVYQHCNTRWYSGAGIIRDVTLISTLKTYLVTDGIYIVNRPHKNNAQKWTCKITSEVTGEIQNHTIKNTLISSDGKIAELKLISSSLFDNKFTQTFEINSPQIWDIESPYYYYCTTELLDKKGTVVDAITNHCGFKTAVFDSKKGFFLNGRHVKICGACHHHDQGALGAAFNINALRRQFNKLKDMGVNAIRTSHNPPPTAFLNLADEMGFLIDDECFDMWESSKTPFDYANYFTDWHRRDVTNWIKKDRNHPSLIMWSIGNEIYDTHNGNGFEITKNLSKIVREFDSESNALITIASNYMMTEGPQKCADEIETVGYNYLERLYHEHHTQHPEWRIYGSETSSTVQSRGIYHFPETLNLVTFSDGQCSSLGNCTVPWSAKNTQTLITFERDCPYSAGQFIWTGWDYIGEPTPYHTKNSYFGQIDTAGFPKDTYFLYKSEWGGKIGEVHNGKTVEPFVHLFPYWDWNEGQLIDIKAYTNATEIELFFNGQSLGRQKIDHEKTAEPFGRWQVKYHKGEIKAVAYDDDSKVIGEDVKRSFGDPAKIILQSETEKTGNLHFINIMTADENGELVENARNYITFNVTGKAELVGMDNGDSTDYDEYTPNGGNSLSRKLFSNRLVAIVRSKGNAHESFVITAASKGLPTISMKYDGQKWLDVAPYYAIKPEWNFVPTRKIELCTKANSSTNMNTSNKSIIVEAKVLPTNATYKEINWDPVLKECVPCDCIKVEKCETIPSESVTHNYESENATLPHVESAKIIAQCDGECILRCTAKNGTNLDEVISDLNFTVQGLGNPKLDPYMLIEGCRFTSWDSEREKTPITLESGISNRKIGPTWVAYEKVDFGVEGADTIHIPIFSFETELPVEVWDGTPPNGTTYEGAVSKVHSNSQCLGKFIYKHESVYNTYNENIYTLSKRLFGVHTITIVLPHEVYFKGFYFDKTKKATSKLRALDADLISGDTFTKRDDINVVEHIGNNVSIDFSNMDFSYSDDDKCSSKKQFTLTICGKSHKENCTINVKFFGEGGTNSTQVIEFTNKNKVETYEEKTFTLQQVSGKQKVSFVFLPGSDFDFSWFKFRLNYL